MSTALFVAYHFVAYNWKSGRVEGFGSCVVVDQTPPRTGDDLIALGDRIAADCRKGSLVLMDSVSIVITNWIEMES